MSLPKLINPFKRPLPQGPKICSSCGTENVNMNFVMTDKTTKFICADTYACGDRVELKEKQKREEREKQYRLEMEKMGKEFKEKYGEVGMEDLIDIGCLYRDAVNYYYHAESNTLFTRELFGSGSFKHSDHPINDEVKKRFKEKTFKL